MRRIRPLTETLTEIGLPSNIKQPRLLLTDHFSGLEYLIPILLGSHLGLISQLRVQGSIAGLLQHGTIPQPHLYNPRRIRHQDRLSSVSEKPFYFGRSPTSRTRNKTSRQHFVSLRAVLLRQGSGLCALIRMRQPGASTRPSHAPHWPHSSNLLDHHHQHTHTHPQSPTRSLRLFLSASRYASLTLGHLCYRRCAYLFSGDRRYKRTCSPFRTCGHKPDFYLMKTRRGVDLPTHCHGPYNNSFYVHAVSKSFK